MANIDTTIKLAISTEFLSSYSKIPKDKQARVREFINKFKQNPCSPGLNYEKIFDAIDPNLRSARVNEEYRAIVLKPDAGNVFMLLWVDHHDDAYTWARKRKFEIHPETGALQVIDIDTIQAPLSLGPTVESTLFDAFRDRELIRLGIPKEILSSVRALKTEQELEKLCGKIPEEAYEALFMLAAGFSQEEVYNQLVARQIETPVDTTDFVTALQQKDSQRRFALVQDDLALEEMLAAPLERWRVFLHPSQRKIVEMKANGPVRVLGGAGTGKTVVAMHRAKWLAEEVFAGDSDYILFTTFTKNLATDIRSNLHKICSPHIMKRLEVINIDEWVARFLKQQGYEYKVVFDKDTEPLWANAINLKDPTLSFPDRFYKEEWDNIIQPQGVNSWEEYMHANRVGRGCRLSRMERKKVWRVFEEYRSQLNREQYKELIDATRDARHLLMQRGDILPYRSIIVDEAQDMNAEVFRLLRQMIPVKEGNRPNDIFITGDTHQRIYKYKVVLSQCGINILGRSRTLRINYRTTEETRRWAVQLLEGLSFDDLEGGEDHLKGYKSLLQGPAPTILRCEDFPQEIEAIDQHIKTLHDQGTEHRDICLVSRTNSLSEQYKGALLSKGYKVYQIHRNTPENRNEPGIRFATMHRVKGLEFDHIIIAGTNDGVVPLKQALVDDNPFEYAESEKRERSLLYVAATRAKHTVLITTSGTPSSFLVKD